MILKLLLKNFKIGEARFPTEVFFHKGHFFEHGVFFWRITV